MAGVTPDTRGDGRPDITPGTTPSREEVEVLQQALRAVRRIRHGHVHIIIQDSKVVQIEQTEKVRLETSARARTVRRS